MNGKKSKRLRAQAKYVLVDWLKSLVSDDEASKITTDNYNSMIPDQTYIYLASSFRMNSFGDRWTVKQVKKFHRKNPDTPISDISFEKLKELLNV